MYHFVSYLAVLHTLCRQQVAIAQAVSWADFPGNSTISQELSLEVDLQHHMHE